MSYVFKIGDDQLDEVVRAELEFQLDCCEPSEVELIKALETVIDIFTPPSEIVAREMEQQSYMYGRYDDPVKVTPENINFSFHFGV